MKIGRVTDDTLALFARVWRERGRQYLPQMLTILALVVVIAATTSFYPLLIKAAFDAFADPIGAEATGFVRRMERLVSKSINFEIGVVNAVAPVERIRSCPLGLKSHTSLCPLHKELDKAYAATEAAFAAVTLKSLIESTDPIVPLCDITVAG